MDFHKSSTVTRERLSEQRPSEQFPLNEEKGFQSTRLPLVKRLLQADNLRRTALAVIVALAAWLRFANLAALGYANHYYTAAVASMLQSWHNFFFVAAEPGASVSVDKPPVGLWLQAISAYFLGVNGFAVLLPQILAGILSVVVVYYLVRRSFGTAAGLAAALVLATTPVVVAVDRNNTIDSTLILTLLLAAWAFILAAEKGKLRYLLLGAALVGVGFNIKMLEAYLPLPAFLALYLLGSAEGLWRKLFNLGLAVVLLVVVSLSWAVTVDLTPAYARPYVGSSGDNSVLSLALGYNGVERLVGMGGGRGRNRPGGFGNMPPGTQPRQPGANGPFMPPGSGGNGTRGQDREYGGFQLPGERTFGARRQPGGYGFFPQQGFNGAGPGFGIPGVGTPGGFQPGRPGGGFGGGFGGGMDTGRAGPLRMFTPPLSNEMSWLLPYALFSLLLLVFMTRPRWPLAQKHQAVVLWGGWLLTGGVFFSIAGFFHPYYLAMIGAPLAALAGIGVGELWQLYRRRAWLAVALLLAAAAATLGFELYIVQAFLRQAGSLPFATGLALVGAALLVVMTRLQRRVGAVAGFSCLATALLVAPLVWSWLTVQHSSPNQSLPAAYSGQQGEPANRGGLQVNQTLLDYLQQHTQGVAYLMAVPSSMQGADYVLATGRPVLYLGGFMGVDKVVTGEDLTRLVADSELRYIYWNSRGGRFGGGGPGGSGNESEITNWVTSQCQPVTGFDVTTRNSGAPDGTSGAQPGGGGFFPGGNMQVALYDCGTNQ